MSSISVTASPNAAIFLFTIGALKHPNRALRLQVPTLLFSFGIIVLGLGMAKGLIWATAEDLARNRGQVLSLYRQILRSLNSPNLPLNLAARLAKKAEVRGIFMLAAEERSVHNIRDLINAAEYPLSLLRKWEIPKYIQ